MPIKTGSHAPRYAPLRKGVSKVDRTIALPLLHRGDIVAFDDSYISRKREVLRTRFRSLRGTVLETIRGIRPGHADFVRVDFGVYGVLLVRWSDLKLVVPGEDAA